MNEIARPYATSQPVSLTAISRHLDVSLPMVRPVMARLGCKTLPGRRYDMVDVWRRMWGIDRVPMAFVHVMEQPLLSIESVAKMVGSHPATIRRNGNDCSAVWNLPQHFDLGPRLRKYLPLHIDAWMRGEEPAEWLRRRHGPAGPLGLRLRVAAEAKDRGAMSN